jgi:ketosteroid isomerase-like protein
VCTSSIAEAKWYGRRLERLQRIARPFLQTTFIALSRETETPVAKMGPLGLNVVQLERALERSLHPSRRNRSRKRNGWPSAPTGMKEKAMTAPSAVQTNENVVIAKAAYQAYVTKDRGALEAVLAEDFHFTSPLDNRLDRETYFRRCWPNSKTIEAFNFINLVTDGDRVFVTYEGRNTNGRRFRNTEILTIRNELIVDVEVYFGWSLPHKAPPGGFVNEAEPK